MKDSVRIMSIQHGDESVEYDPAVEADVERIIRYIEEKQKEGYTLYYRKRGEATWKHIKAADMKNVNSRDEIILGREIDKMMVPPLTGG